MADQHDTLFYDGGCGLCRSEMDHLSQQDIPDLVLRNIHDLSPEEMAAGITKQDLLSRLHVLTHDGRWLKGAEANLYVWAKTAKAPFVKPFQSWPLKVLPIVAYEIWLVFYRLRKSFGDRR